MSACPCGISSGTHSSFYSQAKLTTQKMSIIDCCHIFFTATSVRYHVFSIVVGVMVLSGLIVYYIVVDSNMWGHIYAGISIFIAITVCIVPGAINLSRIYQANGGSWEGNRHRDDLPADSETGGQPRTFSSRSARSTRSIRSTGDIARNSSLNTIAYSQRLPGRSNTNRSYTPSQPIFMNESNSDLFDEAPPNYNDLVGERRSRKHSKKEQP